jgi:hypothetical protein
MNTIHRIPSDVAFTATVKVEFVFLVNGRGPAFARERPLRANDPTLWNLTRRLSDANSRRRCGIRGGMSTEGASLSLPLAPAKVR